MTSFYTSRSYYQFRIFLLAFSCMLLSSSILAQGGPGTALRYDGAQNDYTTLPAGIVSTLTGDFTIEFWVYWQGTGATASDSANINVQPNFQRVFDFGNSENEWMFFTPSSNFGTLGATFAMSNTGGVTPFVVQSPDRLPLNTWNHVAITLNSTTDTAKLFINGVLMGSTGGFTFTASMLGSTTNNWLGRSQYVADPYFHGIIDEFRISNIVRYTTNFTPVPNQFVVDANTIALYHFNEGTGQVSANAQTNAYGNAILGATVAVEGVDPQWITNSILPVNILNFGAQKSGSNIVLNWRAAITGEGGKFIITRSQNGRDFTEIGSLDFTASGDVKSFTYTDAAPNTGKNFYRIQVVEAFVPVKYSSIVWVDMNDKADYGLYPSAAFSELFIKIPKGSKVAFYNNAGLLVKRIQLANSQLVDISALGKGNYFVQIEGSEQVFRFIKL